MPEIPLKISRAIICKKARELRNNNFMGQGESVLCNFAERAPMPNYKGDREPPRRRNLDVKDRDREIVYILVIFLYYFIDVILSI